MALFEYTGRTTAGESVRGRLEGGSAASVAGELTAQGILPVRIDPATSETADAFDQFKRWWHQRSISLTDLIMFCRQMKTLTQSGVPITRALRGLSETMRNPEFGRTLSEVADELEKGHDLAGVLGRQPKIFSKLFVSIVHLGETSGRLEDSFEQLHGYLTLEDETRKRIKSALRYPTMVIVSIVVAVGVINAFVIPPFIKLFASFGEDLPWTTQLLMTTSELTTRYWHFGVVFIAMGWWIFRKWLGTVEGRKTFDRLQLQAPGLGDILERALLARFCRTLAITLGAGLPVTQCLSIAARAVDNEHVAERILDMRKDIEGGDSLTNAAHGAHLFTPLVLQMLAVGEETGGVEQALTEVASYYEREVDYDLKRVSESIEPIMLIFVGALVLCLAMGVYLPMWEMASAARG